MKERAGTDAVVATGSDVRTKHGASEKPEAERASSLVAALGSGRASAEEVFAAFEELDELPPDLVRQALSRWTGPAPDPEELDPTIRKVHGLPPRRLRLRTVAIVKDADVLDLGPVAEEQLRVAGRSWDGADLAPEERLDGERDDSFAGTLELRAVADVETGTPLFDVLLFCGDSGVVFRAGTTDQVGAIAYGKVEMTDRRARAALEEALSSDEVVTSSASAPAEPAVTETATAKKATAKKATAKKATAKTATAKKATAKKAKTAKTATAKTAKKATAEEAASSKATSTKKAPAKPSAKKAASSRSIKD